MRNINSPLTNDKVLKTLKIQANEYVKDPSQEGAKLEKVKIIIRRS